MVDHGGHQVVALGHRVQRQARRIGHGVDHVDVLGHQAGVFGKAFFRLQPALLHVGGQLVPGRLPGPGLLHRLGVAKGLHLLDQLGVLLVHLGGAGLAVGLQAVVTAQHHAGDAAVCLQRQLQLDGGAHRVDAGFFRLGHGDLAAFVGHQLHQRHGAHDRCDQTDGAELLPQIHAAKGVFHGLLAEVGTVG